jgi:hypothetical protein
MKLYYPLHVLTWHPEHLKLKQDGVEGFASIGYMPVFASIDELRKHFPTQPYGTLNIVGPASGSKIMDGIAPSPKT